MTPSLVEKNTPPSRKIATSCQKTPSQTYFALKFTSKSNGSLWRTCNAQSEVHAVGGEVKIN